MTVMPRPIRPDALHTTQDAARALDVPAGLIRVWRHRGKAMPAGLTPAPVPGGLQPLWNLAELRPLAEAYHRRRTAADRQT